MASALYIAVGALGALSIPNVSDNMLSSMIIGDFGKTTQISASLFAFFIIGLGIPLFCVLMKMNLVGSGLCTSTQGNMVAVFLPWLIGWLFYKGSAAAKLLSWVESYSQVLLHSLRHCYCLFIVLQKIWLVL